MNNKSVIFFLFFILLSWNNDALVFGQTGPGGVGSTDGSSSLQFWYRSTDVVENSGVETLTDLSGRSNHATQAISAQRPTLVSGALNGFPAVSFTPANDHFMPINGDLFVGTDFTFFYVAARQSDGYRLIIGGSEGSANQNFHMGWRTTTGAISNFWTNDYQPNLLTPATTRGSGNIGTHGENAYGIFSHRLASTLSDGRRVYQNSAQLGTGLANNNQMTAFPGASFGARRQALDEFYAVNLVESILFSEPLSHTQRILVENYLAIRYNIDLNANSYYTNSAYQQGLSGIGFASGSSAITGPTNIGGLALRQLGSDPLVAGDFILAAHNQTVTNTVVTSDLPAGVEERWARDWYLETTGGVSAEIGFNFIEAIPNSTPSIPDDYVLLFRSGTSGDYSVLSSSASVVGATVVFEIDGADLVDGYYTLGTENAELSRIEGGGTAFYTYQSGNWENWTTWTTDPSGTLLINPDNEIPELGDLAIILNSRTVTITGNNASASVVDIRAGTTVNIGTTTGHSLGFITGTGRFRLANANLPSANWSSFLGENGGTVEFNNTSSFTIDPDYSSYRNLVINLGSDSDVVTQTHNLTIHGDLTITRGQYQINDATARRLSLTIRNDLSVSSNGSIRVGTGDTRSGYSTASLPPTGQFQYGVSHDVRIGGNLTNNGDIRFSNQSGPVYNNFATNGAATVTFTGTQNNKAELNGRTDFYNLILDKGEDQTFELEVNSSAVGHFRLFGPNAAGRTTDGSFTGANPEVRKSLWLRNGTLRLTGTMLIPTLGERNTMAGGNGDFPIPENGKLWIDSPNVEVFVTAQNNGQTLVDGVEGSGVQGGSGNAALTIFGTFRISDGYFSTRNSAGIIYWADASGTVIIEGGEVDASQLRSAAAGGGTAAYIQTGGTVTLRGNTGPFGGEVSGSSAIFSIESDEVVFDMRDGLLHVTQRTNEGAILVESSTTNTNVTGGTVRISTSGNNVEFGVDVVVPFYNFEIVRISGNANTRVQLRDDLVVLNDLIMESNTPRFRTEDFDLTIGRNFTNGGVLTSGTNTVTFNGTSQTITLNTGSTLELHNLTFSNATSVSITGTLATASPLEIEGTLEIGSGVSLNLNDYSLEAETGLSNSGIVTGNGAIRFIGNNASALTIGGTNGTFSNLSLNNTGGGGFTLAGAQTITGALRLAANNILNIGNHNLRFEENGVIYNALTGTNQTYNSFSATQYIRMSGSVAAGGVTRTVSGTGGTQVLHFPVGADDFNPARITVTPNDNIGGTFTVRSVPVQHPSTGTVTDYLEQYWVVSSTGFSTLPDVKYLFQYQNSQAEGDQSNYATHIISDDFLWLSNSTDDVNATDNLMYYPDDDGADTGATTTIIQAEFTAGNNFENPTIFYSRDSGNWNTIATWSTDSHEGDPAVTIPGSGNPVFIHQDHAIFVDGSAANASSVQINGTLDLRATAGNLGNLSGQGLLRMSSENLPNADPTAFVSTSGGTVEYYRDAGNFTISDAWEIYRNLIISTAGGNAGTITLPPTDVLVRDSLKIGSTSNNGALTVQSNTDDDYTITIGKNLLVLGGSAANSATFTLESGSDTELIVEGNIKVLNHGALQVAGSGSDQNHNIVVGRNAANTGSVRIDGVLDLASGNRIADLKLTGNRFATISGTSSTVNLNSLTLNKSQRDTTVQITLSQSNALTFQGSVDNPGLEIINGTLRISSPQTITLSDGDDFTLNATSRLFNDGGTLQMDGPNGTALILEGVLRQDSGTTNIGTGSTDVAIEYKGAGTSLILVNGGTLNVTGQIRRNPVPTTGALRYRQAGGNVYVGTQSVTVTNRSVFEALNTGSEFTMSGGNLFIVRSLGNTTADLRITPTTQNVTGGTIIFGRDDVDPGANQTYRMNVNISLQNLEIRRNGSRLNAVRPQTNPVTLKGNLLINEGTTLNMAASNLNLTIAGNFTNSGTYSAGSNTTTFNGSAQSITGETTFHRLTVSSGTTSLQDDIQVNNVLQINSASFLNDNGYEVDVRNNVTITGTHQSVSTGAIVFNGTVAQTISGGGSLANVRIENAENITLSSDLTITGTLTFGGSSGHLAIGSRLLQLTNPAMNMITGASADRHIRTNGSISDQGIRKTVPGGVTSSTFTVPVGITGKYTPATFTFTTGASGGTVRVLPVNQIHPNANGPGDDILKYYWAVFSTIADLSAITHSYVYNDSDIEGNENNFVAARFNNAEWTAPGGSVNTATNTISFTNTNLSGAYTAGIASRFEDPPTYFSNASGAFNANIWVDEDDNPLAFPPPSGVSVVIRNSHTITVPADGILTSELIIQAGGTLDLEETKGHNLGIISGAGLLRMEPSDQAFPAGNFDPFIDDGGTIEYYSDSDIVLPDRSVYSNLELTGNVTKSLAANDIEVRGNLIINEGTFNANNRIITLRGNWLNNSSSTAFTAGTGTVILQGTAAQNIGGSEPTTFHNLTISNGQETNSLSRNLTISGVVNLSNGRLNLGDQTITISTTGSLSESSDHFIYSNTGSGVITMTPRNVGTSPGNVAGLGFEIVSTEKPLGNNTVITRYFNSRFFAPPADAESDFQDDLGVRRWFSVSSDGITANNSGFNALVRFYYSPDWDFTGTRITPETMALYRSTDNGTTWLPVGGNLDAGNTRIEAGGIDGFSEWTAFNNDVLPVELARFEISPITFADRDAVKLEWETATELENYGFFIYRSQPNPSHADEAIYTNIGFIEGAGTIFTRQFYEFIDDDIPQAGTYLYQLLQMDYDGKTETYGPIEVTILPPSEFVLHSNFPNPFNPITTIPYSVPKETLVRIEVYNILGQRVQVLVNEIVPPGQYQAVFDGTRLSSGVYLVRMVADGNAFTRKMMLVK